MIVDCCAENFDFSFNAKNPIVRLHEPTFRAEEIFAAIMPMLETRVTMGDRVKKFEKAYGSALGYSHCVMNNSGSSANLLALSAARSSNFSHQIPAGSEVIVPALSWATTIWPIVQNGLVPVFVDCDPKTWNLDINEVKKAITSDTKAIMLVHVYGNPCNMDDICHLADEYGLHIIEDSCESMGAFFRGQSVGSFGLAGTFSFYFSHHITTLEGGICVTEDFELSEIMRIQRAHGWSREAVEKDAYEAKYSDIDPRFIFVDTGYNLRPTECQAAIGMVQLPKLNDIVNIRRENVKNLRERLDKHSDLFEFQDETEHGRSSWFGFGLKIRDNKRLSVKSITKHLQANGIETRPVIAGNMARHPALKDVNHRCFGDLAHSSKIMDDGFAFGCHHAMGSDAVEYICDQIDNFVRQH